MSFMSIADAFAPTKNESTVAQSHFAEMDFRRKCRHLEPELVDLYVQSTYSQFDNVLDLCESPIERMLLGWLLFANYGDIQHRPTTHRMEAPFLPDRGIIIIPQFPFLNYRLDFAVILKRKELSAIIAVECDGRQFHTSFADREHDAIRDGRLASWGIHTVRATGADIYRDPAAVASEVGTIAQGIKLP